MSSQGPALILLSRALLAPSFDSHPPFSFFVPSPSPMPLSFEKFSPPCFSEIVQMLPRRFPFG